MLEAMVPFNAFAQSVKKRPNRIAYVFVPNGIHMPAWTPAKEGSLELQPIMASLSKVKSNLNILTGLTQRNAFALGDGAGDHARSAAAWLTGCHPRKTDGADIKNGISADQVIAQRIGHLTRFPSLELGCERGAQAGNCDSGYSCAYSSNIAWRSESTPVAHDVDPRAVFERLFGSGADVNLSPEERKRRNTYRKSILDNVTDDAKQLQNRLGTRDRAKLDEYFNAIRDIERRLQMSEQSKLGDKLNVTLRPDGIPREFGDHIRIMFDMLFLAFQTDMTRVATFMIANEGSNRAYADIGVPDGHHDCSHHGRDQQKLDKIQKINTFHMEQFAYFLERLQSTNEVDGTMLDNSMIVYGGGIGDGDRHNHDDLPILLAGKGAGTIRTGRHVVYKNGTPMTNLFVSMFERVGIPADTIGDSTGKLAQLF